MVAPASASRPPPARSNTNPFATPSVSSASDDQSHQQQRQRAGSPYQNQPSRSAVHKRSTYEDADSRSRGDSMSTEERYRYEQPWLSDQQQHRQQQERQFQLEYTMKRNT
eukprot:CAMPEP_0119570062 /NCGR_PEP_ID=MMETSP1352-20130426/43390_1 /TAXON_ID=265584 /ORGANISM="Stauroneis constricta, Strain CCMP1120" /LENGTH=109 /DNA_ID=CAMNT_0007619727 /DNA_START=174 /DNA_END=499 /DNA_ORIENTATION=+